MFQNWNQEPFGSRLDDGLVLVHVCKNFDKRLDTQQRPRCDPDKSTEAVLDRSCTSICRCTKNIKPSMDKCWCRGCGVGSGAVWVDCSHEWISKNHEWMFVCPLKIAIDNGKVSVNEVVRGGRAAEQMCDMRGKKQKSKLETVSEMWRIEQKLRWGKYEQLFRKCEWCGGATRAWTDAMEVATSLKGGTATRPLRRVADVDRWRNNTLLDWEARKSGL